MNITHPQLVAVLVKPGQAIIDTLDPAKANLLHMTVGVSGEAGELLDAIKKHVIYNKPVDRENVVEELGDLEFYLEGIRAQMGITREETIAGNIAKLSKRYASFTYSDQAAQDRADKVEDPYAGWTFESPHFVNSEDCMGVPVSYHRVFAKGPAGEVASGTSRDSAEQALVKCQEHVLEKKNKAQVK